MRYLPLISSSLLLLFLCAPVRGDDFWGPSTSGPFFTNTAEAGELGSFYIEPWYYGFIQKGQPTQHTIYQQIGAGLGNDFNLMVQEPFVFQGGQSGFSNTSVTLKKTFAHDSDTNNVIGVPAMAIAVTDNLPVGTYGVQANSWSVEFIFHKRFKPFQLYWQFGNQPVSFTQDATGSIWNYSVAFEHVLDDKTGLGYIMEFYGQTQGGGFSYLWAAPAVEWNPVTEKGFSINLGVGVELPVYQVNYPLTCAPMFTITINFNSPGAQGE